MASASDGAFARPELRSLDRMELLVQELVERTVADVVGSAEMLVVRTLGSGRCLAAIDAAVERQLRSCPDWCLPHRGAAVPEPWEEMHSEICALRGIVEAARQAMADGAASRHRRELERLSQE